MNAVDSRGIIHTGEVFCDERVQRSCLRRLHLWRAEWLDVTGNDEAHTLWISPVGSLASGDQIESVLINAEAWNDID